MNARTTITSAMIPRLLADAALMISGTAFKASVSTYPPSHPDVSALVCDCRSDVTMQSPGRRPGVDQIAACGRYTSKVEYQLSIPRAVVGCGVNSTLTQPSPVGEGFIKECLRVGRKRSSRSRRCALLLQAGSPVEDDGDAGADIGPGVRGPSS